MTVLREPVQTDPLIRNIWISVALHVGLVAAFALKAAWIPSDDLLIRSAIRVDVVGMPDKVQPPPEPAKETAKPAPPPKVAPVTPPKPEVKAPTVPIKKDKAPDLKQAEISQKKAMEKLRAMQAIEKMKSEVADKEARARAAKTPTFKGNQLNPGDSLTGLEKLEFDRYFGTLENQLRSNWNLPSWLAQAELKAQAMVLIGADGQVNKRQIIKSSGNEVFDAEVLAAIDKSSPFPQPPARLKDVLALNGIVFNFPD